MLTLTGIDLSSISTLTLKEIEERFPLIGQGQARSVYDLGNGLVLKIAESGMEFDNETEFKVWSESNDSLKRFLTPCLLDPNDSQKLYMVKGEKLTVQKVDFEGYLISHFDIPLYTQLLNAVYELSNDFRLMYHDLLLPQNWASVNGELKLIDYGMSIDNDFDDEEE